MSPRRCVGVVTGIGDDADGAGTPATDDPYAEGGAATTQEWFGRSVERDTELAERLVDEHDGDADAAKATFDARP